MGFLKKILGLDKSSNGGTRRTTWAITIKGNIYDLKDANDGLAKKVWYIYERSNEKQKNTIKFMVEPYIVLSGTHVHLENDAWDNDEDWNQDKKLDSFDLPYDIESKINYLYDEMVKRGTQTIEEQKQMKEDAERQKIIEHCVDTFFNE